MVIFTAILIGLSKLARAARRATTLSRRLIFGLFTILVSLVGLMSSIPFQMTFGTFHLSINLGLLFIVPLILGVLGLFGARHEPVA